MSTETEALIQEMVLSAEKAAEPGSGESKIVSKGDSEDYPLPMVTSKLLSAGYCYIYNRETGDRSVTNMNMLPTQLKKKDAEGNLVFTTIRPKNSPVLGTFKCMLHPDDSNRAYYNSLGMAVCKKGNLTSPYQVRRHMQKRHKDEWAAIEEERKAKEDSRQKLLNEAMLAQLSATLTKTK